MMIRFLWEKGENRQMGRQKPFGANMVGGERFLPKTAPGTQGDGGAHNKGLGKASARQANGEFFHRRSVQRGKGARLP